MKDRRRLERAVAVIFALIVWQVGAMLLNKTLLLVSPVVVEQRFVGLCAETDFWVTIGFSLMRIAFGYLIALVCGILLAVIAAKLHFAEMLFWPFIHVMKSVPVVSFIILCLIWLTARNLSVFIAFLMVLPIIYTNVLEGFKSTDVKLLEMAQLFRIGWLKKIKYIYLPQLKPYLISACSVAIGLSWKAGIAAEVIGIPEGSIGEKLYEAKLYLNSPDLFAWTVMIVLLSVLFEKLFLFLLNTSFKRLEKA